MGYVHLKFKLELTPADVRALKAIDSMLAALFELNGAGTDTYSSLAHQSGGPYGDVYRGMIRTMDEFLGHIEFPYIPTFNSPDQITAIEWANECSDNGERADYNLRVLIERRL